MDSEVIEKIATMIGEYGNRYGKEYNFNVEGGGSDTIFVTDHKMEKTYCISITECEHYEGK